jgi:hypothetical protein
MCQALGEEQYGKEIGISAPWELTFWWLKAEISSREKTKAGLADRK